PLVLSASRRRSLASRALGMAMLLLFLSPWVVVKGCSSPIQVEGWIAVAFTAGAIDPDESQRQAKKFQEAKSTSERADIPIAALGGLALVVAALPRESLAWGGRAELSLLALALALELAPLLRVTRAPAIACVALALVPAAALAVDSFLIDPLILIASGVSTRI